MRITPPSSRNQIRWMKVARTDSGELHVVVEPFYAQLFDLALPEIAKLNITGWRQSKNPRFNYAFFENVDDQALYEVQRFREDFKRLVILAPNKNTQDDFSTELDFCMALDYNFDSPGGPRTKVGRWLYTAKYDRSATQPVRERRVARLIKGLLDGFGRLPGIDDCESVMLTCPPVPPGKRADLPTRLVAGLVEPLGALGHRVELLSAGLLDPKPEMKDELLAGKREYWRGVVAGDRVELSGDVRGRSVLIIDDLYKSGFTMWSYAKLLKNKGAFSVSGLCCVKSLRDDDSHES